MEICRRIQLGRIFAVAGLVLVNVGLPVLGQSAPVPGLAPIFAQFPIFGGTRSPMTVPTDQPEPTPAPVVVPVAPTLPAPTPEVAPITPPPVPTPIVIPTVVPAPAPVPIPVTATVTGVPTMSPGGAPIIAPANATSSPTTLFPTRPPQVAVSGAPSVVPLSSNTTAPTGSPFIEVNEPVRNLRLVYPNVTMPLSDQDLTMVEIITQQWWSAFYNSPEGRRRLLRGAPRELLRNSIFNVTTEINITDSGFFDASNSSTFILYDQIVQYLAEAEANSTPSDYAIYPFTDAAAVTSYSSQLSDNIAPFVNVSGITPPEVNGPAPVPAPVQAPVKAPVYNSKDNHKLSGGGIAGIAIAAAFVLLVGYYVGTTWYHMRNEQKDKEEVAMSAEPSFIAQENTFISQDKSRAFAQVEKGLFVVYAPSGKLGFSLDKPDEGPLIIYVVKEDSSLVDLIQRGDRLVAVDEENVRNASPAFVVNLLKQRMQNPWRRMTLIREDETTANDPEGQYVVYAPSDKLGFSIEKNNEAVPPVVRAVKDDSVLLDVVEVGDELHSIDEVDVTGMTAKDAVQTLISRKDNPSRKLVFRRVIPDSPTTLPENYEPSAEGLYISFAPAGKLGFSLQSPDEDAMIVYNIKDDSPLMNQVQPGDRLVGIDDVDVRTLSPTRVVNLLSARKANVWRKLTLIRRGAEVSLGETFQIEEGEIVIYVPAGKLGFSLNNPDDGAPIFQIVKEDSILADTVRVGDRLMSLDGVDTSGMHAGKVVKMLISKKDNPSRKIVVHRGSGAAVLEIKPAPPPAPALGPNTYVVKAPAGKLGVILDNPDEGPPMIHSVKDTSVLLGQLNVGDRLIMIDDVDVRSFSPAQVVQLLSTKSSNPVRLLTMSSGAAVLEQEPEISLTDVENSTMSGGESLGGGESLAMTEDLESEADGKQ
jgi:C-terminal processing protease CtpA/Prc